MFGISSGYDHNENLFAYFWSKISYAAMKKLSCFQMNYK